MGLSGKVETEIVIQATAAKFYNNIFKEYEGERQNIVGSVKHWDFTIEGKKQSAKERIESKDDENKIITYSFFDGEVGDSYKIFNVTLQVIDKEHGGVVKWSLEYEKLKEDIIAASPNSFLDFATKAIQETDANLVKEI